MLALQMRRGGVMGKTDANSVFGSQLAALYLPENVTLADGTVSTWPTSSEAHPNGRDMTATVTAASTPTVIPSGKLGRPALRFDGVNDRLASQANYMFPSGAVVVAYVAAVQRTIPNSGKIDAVLGSSNNYQDTGATSFLYNPFNNLNSYRFSSDGTSSRTIRMNGRDGADETLTKGQYVIGLMAFSDHPGDKSWNIGSFRNNTSNHYGQVDIGEIILITSTQDNLTTDSDKVEGYLAWAWDLVSDLPSNHPYKNSPPRG